MKPSIKTGFSFGLTSGIITTLGLIVGLHSGTHSKIVIMGGILTIAIADAFSDALGIHVSEESKNKNSNGQIWLATITTFLSKLIFALTFIIPILILELSLAIIVSVIWGLLVLGIFSYLLSRQRKEDVWKGVLEHEFIALMVIVATHFVGDWIAQAFK